MTTVATCVLSAALAACSSGDSDPVLVGQGGSAGTGVAKGGDTYVAGLEKEGESGLYTLRLLESAPIPKDTGLYSWTIQLLDADDNAIDATIVAEPRMPAHDHGTFPPFTEAAPQSETGTYMLESMDLFMPGIWEVTIRVMNEEEIEDEAKYYFDLEG